MNKYEVWVTIWSEELKRQIKVVAGEFTDPINVKLFVSAYREKYKTQPEIVEYVKANCN